VKLEVAVKTIARTLLVVALSAGMVSAPAFAAAAADEKPLGLVTQAQMAQLGDAKASIGTTVYPGDTLATDQGGILRLKVGNSQIYLLASSSATLSENSTAVSAKVNHGTVGMSTASSEPVALDIPEGILRPAGGSPAYGQVTIVAPNEVVISAYSGSLVLDNDGEMHTIPAGKTYRVTMDLTPSEAQPQDAAGAQTNNKNQMPRAARHRHLVFDVVMAGAAGIAAYELYEHLTVSPSSPNN
jgi:hypothetical protein